jgi:ABC-type antimicrobial peptide transport system permease subunit
METMVRRGSQGAFMSLEPILRDEELRVVAGQMEQNLALMQLLYPVVIAVSVVIGAGLAVLLMLQNARIAAILRVLGFGKVRTRGMLCSEHVIVAVFGVIVGFVVMPLIGISLVGEMPLLACLYVLGAFIGAISGAVIITSRAPLQLLQVKE